MDITLDLSAIERAGEVFGQEMQRETTRAVWAAADAGAQEARSSARFKDRSGDLRKSIQGRAIDMNTAELVATAPYASFVDEGTDPHLIHAKKGVALRFEMPADSGNVVFRRYVFHPGTTADGFFARGQEKAEEVLSAGLAEAAQKAAQRAFGGSAKLTLGTTEVKSKVSRERARDERGKFVKAA